MSYQERILRVMLYIQNHLDDECSLDHLAGVACFSPFHFHRIFRGMTGEPVKEYVRRLRLERAAQQLKATADPVTDVAFDAGYESHEAFTRAFHARFGVPPSAYRDAHTPRPQSADADVRVVRYPARRVAFVRHVGPYPEVGQAWGKLFRLAGPAGLLGAGLEYFGIMYDDPEVTDPTRLRYDAAIRCGPAFQGKGELAVQELPEREYAVMLHKGPYERLGESYAKLCGEWLPLSGREAAWAPTVEYYRNNPTNTRPEELLTDICAPLV